MGNHELKTIVKYILAGVVVAIGGMLFSDLFANFFNGLQYGDAVILGIGMYLCIVIISCTGIIISKISKK